MKLGMLQGALCKRAKMGVWEQVGESVNNGQSQGHPMWKTTKYALFLPVALDRGWCSVLTYLVWILVLSGRSLAGPLQPACTLRMAQLLQLWTCLQQQRRSKLSISNSQQMRGKKQAQSLQRPFGPTYVMSACQGDLSTLAWGVHLQWCCVWKWRARIHILGCCTVYSLWDTRATAVAAAFKNFSSQLCDTIWS